MQHLIDTAISLMLAVVGALTAAVMNGLRKLLLKHSTTFLPQLYYKDSTFHRSVPNRVHDCKYCTSCLSLIIRFLFFIAMSRIPIIVYSFLPPQCFQPTYKVQITMIPYHIYSISMLNQCCLNILCSHGLYDKNSIFYRSVSHLTHITTITPQL